MNRRSVLAALSGFIGAGISRQPAVARSGAASFDELFKSLLNEGVFAVGRDARERQALEYFEIAEKGLRPRTPMSNVPISDRAKKMIIAFEVTSANAYSRRYRKPIWPAGQSGITFGVGYDAGYVTKEWLHEDWDKVSVSDPAKQQKLRADIIKLEAACGLTGPAAQAALSKFQLIDIEWPIAEQQFHQFVLPRYIGETINALPNSATLSPDCLGALTSLVYNRGASFMLQQDRYREMRAIRRHMEDKKPNLIAAEIRSMKRIWEGQPKMTGLLARRELEARLFEEGLGGQSSRT